MLLVLPSPPLSPPWGATSLSPHAIFSAAQIALQLFREYSPCKQHWQTCSFSPLHSSLKITTRGRRSFRLLKSVWRSFIVFFFSLSFFFVVSLSKTIRSEITAITVAIDERRIRDSKRDIILGSFQLGGLDRRDPSSTESRHPRMKSDHRLIKRFQQLSTRVGVSSFQKLTLV